MLAHKKQIVHTAYNPCAEIYIRHTVEIPVELIGTKNGFGEVFLKLDEAHGYYKMHRALNSWGDFPCLRRHNGEHCNRVILKGAADDVDEPPSPDDNPSKRPRGRRGKLNPQIITEKEKST